MDERINSSAESIGLTENREGFNTILDDVFRTISQKMLFLLIPLINEVLKTTYVEDQKFAQLRNERYEKFGKIVTDSIIQIEEHLYHIECQSRKDGDIALRMIEYDFVLLLNIQKWTTGSSKSVSRNPVCCISGTIVACWIIISQRFVCGRADSNLQSPGDYGTGLYCGQYF